MPRFNQWNSNVLIAAISLKQLIGRQNEMAFQKLLIILFLNKIKTRHAKLTYTLNHMNTNVSTRNSKEQNVIYT